MLVLASRSPRRIELLQRIGHHPVVDPADIDETQNVGESAIDYVVRLSHEKARTVALRHPGCVVVGADTCVELDGVVHGQPVDRADAERILRVLSGRTHNVHTAVTVIADGVAESVVDTARVSLQALSQHLLNWYLDTAEPFGKAGAYAVQGHGGVLVTRVQGSMSTVVGLPLRQVADLLGRAGLSAQPRR
jgi:septum formation protein